MVQFVVGNIGKGKTKHLLNKVNEEVKYTSGNIVYIDNTSKHMYDLNNKIRLINVTDYLISNASEFIGFLSGIISQDNDLHKVYLDSFMEAACITKDNLHEVVDKLELISNKFSVDLLLCLTMEEAEVPEQIKNKILVSL